MAGVEDVDGFVVDLAADEEEVKEGAFRLGFGLVTGPDGEGEVERARFGGWEDV